jgi:formylmethanofuran dehydrogenase subunit C
VAGNQPGWEASGEVALHKKKGQRHALALIVDGSLGRTHAANSITGKLAVNAKPKSWIDLGLSSKKRG